MSTAPAIFGEQLPSINKTSVALALTWGAIVRPVVWGSVYHGLRSLCGTYLKGDKTSVERNSKNFRRTAYSCVAEVGISVVLCPARYLAAVHCSRILLDFAVPSLSDKVGVVDRFAPANFMSFAQFAFLQQGDDEWNMDFFVWQVPSIILTVGKLIARRRRLGAAKCRTKRVLGVLFMHILLRAFTGSFTVQLPQSEGDLLTAVIATSLESLVAKYLIWHTWPFE